MIDAIRATDRRIEPKLIWLVLACMSLTGLLAGCATSVKVQDHPLQATLGTLEPPPAPMPAPIPTPAPVEAPPAYLPAPTAIQAPETISRKVFPTHAGAAQAPVVKESTSAYVATIDANTPLLLPGPPGILHVWIGLESEKPVVPSNGNSSLDTLEDSMQTAKIDPFAPDMAINPPSSGCIRLSPHGSDMRFALTPTRAGPFDVGATINLFDSKDCSGAFISKSLKPVKVNVAVNQHAAIIQHINELKDNTWQDFLKAWNKLWIAVFAIPVLLLKQHIYKRLKIKGDSHSKN